MRGKGGKWEGEMAETRGREKRSKQRGEGKRCRRRWEIGEKSGPEEGEREGGEKDED